MRPLKFELGRLLEDPRCLPVQFEAANAEGVRKGDSILHGEVVDYRFDRTKARYIVVVFVPEIGREINVDARCVLVREHADFLSS